MSAGAEQSRAPQDPTGPPPWSGPWADDARRLFQVLHSAAEQLGGPPEDAERPDGGFEHPPECRYCPFCQGVTLLRKAGPDVLDQLSELAAGLAATLRATQPEPGTPAGAPSGEAAGDAPDDLRDGTPGDGTGAPARPPSTVRIDVTD